ncbi:MAG TPA: hypothetical protein VMT24_09125, partial [Aggregatilineaceae bacterium]|nr:hypothetical protein [Aggregatilineaceae bacterium]
DNGEALPDPLARTLFTSPVPSRQGLGVGLYQAARQASVLGYRVELSRNRPGDVCFNLKQGGAAVIATEDVLQPPAG